MATKPSPTAVALRAATILLGALALQSCDPAAIRQVTYPPSFQYLEQGEVRTAMGRLARDMNRLQTVLSPDGPPPVQQQAEVVRLLRDMEAVAKELVPEGRRTNHPQIDRNIEAFRHELELARAGAERDPPNYFLAGSITGACQSCHRDEAGGLSLRR